jgi:Thrombospondin type 3 repeat
LTITGDACDSDIDLDFDGVQDSIDNCPQVKKIFYYHFNVVFETGVYLFFKVPNSDQIDSDGDGRFVLKIHYVVIE